MTYVRLTLVEEWDKKYYSLNGKKISFKEEQIIRVEWPNGSKSSEKIKIYPYYETIHDHGHRYEVKGELAGVSTKIHGLEVLIKDLSKVKVKI
ncbi:Uncharacterised protein [uncultured archaeon]|nr:Uncharacterised protein [uncultured archaeon]